MNQEPDSRPPDIVLIMSDQHNRAVMGCSGHPLVRTPNLDALARQGTRFTNAYCPFPLCGPSRAGFMTAQYPSTIEVFDGDDFPSSVPTFAHGMGAAGYEAVLCGRMGWGELDQFHGFESRIHGDVLTFDAIHKEIIGRGFNKTGGQTRYAVEVAGHGRTGFQLFDKSVADSARSFISRRRTGDRPYCLVVGLMLPHNPLIGRRELFEYYLERIQAPEPVSKDYLDKLHPALRRWRERREVDDLTPEQNRRGLAAYYALVTELDASVGRIVEAVKDSSRQENTIFIYCSDHGDMACEHGMWWKSNFYEGSIGVPLIFSGPGVAADRVNHSVVSLVDVGPTMLEIAGAEPLPDVAGRSFAAGLRGDGSIPGWPDEVFAEYSGFWGDQPAHMIRSKQWKMNYYHEFKSCQLFNLEEDPGELRDRAADPECREILEGLLRKVGQRWDGDSYKEAHQRQLRASELIRRCGHELSPHEVVHFSGMPDYSQFDFSQLPQPPRPKGEAG